MGTQLEQGSETGEVQKLAEEFQGQDCHVVLERGAGGAEQEVNALSVWDDLLYERGRAKE